MTKNIYVEKWRKVLANLSSSLRDKYSKMRHNNNLYSENVANDYNAEIEAEVTKAINDAKKSAYKVMLSISLAMNQWATVQGRCITKDAELFNGNYPLTVDELEKLASVYSGNFTMLQLIQKYADDNNINVFITPVEKKLEVYEKFYNGCLSAIEQVARSRGNYDNSEYANNAFCNPLFDIIGTGNELQDYKVLRLEVQQPIREYPNPATDENFNFNFKLVQRNNSVTF